MAAAKISLLLLIILSFTLTSGCLQDKSNKTQEITVSAAISLSDALKDIGEGFQKKHPEVKIYFNFGASGTLEKQIEQGASVDIFASASQNEMALLEEKGLIFKASRTNFTGNKLVMISPSRLTFEGLKSLDRIAIGNPKTVPAGLYARTFLENVGMYEVIKPKLIFAENVRQVLDYVERGEVDAGFVYFSDTLTLKSNMSVSSINDSLYPPVVYPIAIVQDSQKPEVSGQFIEYIKSDEGQTILHKHGFG
jgi:molybdate transport system substrate-binding protein